MSKNGTDSTDRNKGYETVNQSLKENDQRRLNELQNPGLFTRFFRFIRVTNPQPEIDRLNRRIAYREANSSRDPNTITQELNSQEQKLASEKQAKANIKNSIRTLTTLSSLIESAEEKRYKNANSRRLGALANASMNSKYQRRGGQAQRRQDMQYITGNYLTPKEIELRKSQEKQLERLKGNLITLYGEERGNSEFNRIKQADLTRDVSPLYSSTNTKTTVAEEIIYQVTSPEHQAQLHIPGEIRTTNNQQGNTQTTEQITSTQQINHSHLSSSLDKIIDAVRKEGDYTERIATTHRRAVQELVRTIGPNNFEILKDKIIEISGREEVHQKDVEINEKRKKYRTAKKYSAEEHEYHTEEQDYHKVKKEYRTQVREALASEISSIMETITPPSKDTAELENSTEPQQQENNAEIPTKKHTQQSTSHIEENPVQPATTTQTTIEVNSVQPATTQLAATTVEQATSTQQVSNSHLSSSLDKIIEAVRKGNDIGSITKFATTHTQRLQNALGGVEEFENLVNKITEISGQQEVQQKNTEITEAARGQATKEAKQEYSAQVREALTSENSPIMEIISSLSKTTEVQQEYGRARGNLEAKNTARTSTHNNARSQQKLQQHQKGQSGEERTI